VNAVSLEIVLHFSHRQFVLSVFADVCLASWKEFLLKHIKDRWVQESHCSRDTQKRPVHQWTSHSTTTSLSHDHQPNHIPL